MINLNQLRKCYSHIPVLDNLSLHFGYGRTTALLGPNGSGKTTLIKSILGLVKPDSGTIHVSGTAVSNDGSYRRQIGYMPQVARYPDNLTIREVLGMISELREEEPKRLHELFKVFELLPHAEKNMKSLSGGTRQKVSAVAAMMFDAPILILDEPTAGLDPLMARRLKDLIITEKAREKTILLTTHIVAEIEELADDIAFILEGSLLFHGSKSELQHATGQQSFEQAVSSLQKNVTFRRAA